MTVAQLKGVLESFDDNTMVLISDGIGWSNIDKIEFKGIDLHIIQETETVFSND